MDDHEQMLVIQSGSDGIAQNIEIIPLNEINDVAASRIERCAYPGRFIVWKDGDNIFLRIISSK